MKKEDTSIVSTSVSLDAVLHRCGDFHRFQWLHLFLLNLIEFAAGIVSLYYVFGAAEPQHRCRLPATIWPNDTHYNPVNSQHEAIMHQYIPMDNSKWDQCHLVNFPAFNHSQIDCVNGWVFDRSIFGFTFTEEASLVCDAKPKKSWLATLVQVAGFALLIIGAFADRFGRKPTMIGVILLLLIICFTMQITMQCIPMSINTKFILLLVNQFSLGLIFSASAVVFILMLELTTSKYRSVAGNIALASFASGAMLITLFAYLTRHWQKLLWTVTGFIALILPYLYYMPESPLHLYSSKQYIKLEALLQRIAQTNGRSDCQWYPAYQQLLNTQPPHTVNKEQMTLIRKVRQLLCHRETTKRLLISSLLAFIGMLLYIKISYGLETMNISPYIGILIGAVVEIVAYLVSNTFMSTRLGRKYSLIIFTSLTCLCVLLIPSLTKHSIIAIVMVSQMGKFAVSASLAVTWIYLSELFPTSIRGSANGVAVAISRLGAIAAPIVDSLVGEKKLFVTFYVYGCVAFLALFSIILVPETKNFSLDKTISEKPHEDGTDV